jgi:hypothetical protein
LTSIGSSLSATVVLPPPVTSAASQALLTLQAIPGVLATQARAAAEARLQFLIKTYHQLASIADLQTLTALARQIGIAAKALGDTASSDIPSATAASSGSAPGQGQTDTAAADTSAKTILVQAGGVLEIIRQRLASTSSLLRRTDAVKTAVAAVKTATQAVDEALSAVGGSATPIPGASASSATLDLLA